VGGRFFERAMSAEATWQDVVEGRARWAVVRADNADVLPLMSEKCVAHVITDPPYSRDLYLRFRSNSRARMTKLSPTGKKMKTPAYLALANEKIGAVDDIVERCGPDFVRLAARWVLAFHDAESGHLWREAFGRAYVRAGVWVKPNPVPQISGDRPGQGFEACSIAHRPGRKRWNGGGLPAVWTHCALQGNWTERQGNDHPCPKPLELMLELVELFTDPDEVILDPFAGSGTTGVACIRLGRRFIGIERDEKYAAIARERLAAEERGLSLRDARAGQTSIFDVLGGT
jgi:16S rRNA G966 N2-methylase RsmD